MAFVQIIAYLDGTPLNGESILRLDEMSIKTSFISKSRNTDTAQPVISTNSLTFVDRAAVQIINYQLGGLTGASVGITEGMPLVMFVDDGITIDKFFDGYLDFNDYEQVSSNMVTCGIKEIDGINSFDILSKNTYFNILEFQGVYTAADFIKIKAVVENPDALGEAASLMLTLTVLLIEAIKVGRDLIKEILPPPIPLAVTNNAVAHTTGGAGGLVAGPAYILTMVAINLVIFGIIVIQIVALMKKLANLLVPPVKRHSAIFEHTLLEKAINSLGFDFETNIVEMRNTVHLPGQPNAVFDNSLGRKVVKEIASGVPKVGQPGDTLAGQINLMLNKYRGLIAIIGNVVHIRSKNDPFWIKNSTLILEDFGDIDVDALNLSSERQNFNLKDLFANRLVSFTRDQSDSYTISEAQGTSFLAITNQKNINDPKRVVLKGLQETRIALSLGARKTELTQVENLLYQVLKAADTLASVMFLNRNMAGLIDGRIGALKLSNTAFNNPKTLYVEFIDGEWEIPKNHRDILSARALYVKYHAEGSFVNTTPSLSITASTDSSVEYKDTATPDYGNQKLLVNEPDFPFGYSQYLKMKNNSYFATSDGRRGKMENNDWRIRESLALLDYWIEHVWTKNLKETFVEPK